jgi:hypothetical protein
MHTLILYRRYTNVSKIIEKGNALTRRAFLLETAGLLAACVTGAGFVVD